VASYTLFKSSLKPAILAGMASIDKEQLEHLASLARLELDPASEEKMLADFGKILEHFVELQELPPRAEILRFPQNDPGSKKVQLRDDANDLPDHFNEPEKIIAQFPETEGRYNRIPPVFE